jgi:hypothetical protein
MKRDKSFIESVGTSMPPKPFVVVVVFVTRFAIITKAGRILYSLEKNPNRNRAGAAW